jgi:Tfp pilus assembly protein PilV
MASRAHLRARAAITLLEVMVAMVLFVIASVGFNGAYYMLNTRATRLRCDTAASSILRAKVAKDMTDPWISQSVPVDCVVTTGSTPVATTADPNDPYDIGPTVTLLSSSDSPQTPTITGTLYRSTYAFESSAQTVVIDYQLTYAFRGRTFSDYASTVRARDY